jgi:hypothetical protein
MPCFIQRTEPPGISVFLGDPIKVATDRPRDEAIRRSHASSSPIS